MSILAVSRPLPRSGSGSGGSTHSRHPRARGPSGALAYGPAGAPALISRSHWSAACRAWARTVRMGLTPAEVGRQLASTIHRLGWSKLRNQGSEALRPDRAPSLPTPGRTKWCAVGALEEPRLPGCAPSGPLRPSYRRRLRTSSAEGNAPDRPDRGCARHRSRSGQDESCLRRGVRSPKRSKDVRGDADVRQVGPVLDQ